MPGALLSLPTFVPDGLGNKRACLQPSALFLFFRTWPASHGCTDAFIALSLSLLGHVVSQRATSPTSMHRRSDERTQGILKSGLRYLDETPKGSDC